jgi:hypothetical protein
MSRHMHIPPPILYAALPKVVETRRRPGLSNVRKTVDGEDVGDAEEFEAAMSGVPPKLPSDSLADEMAKRKRSTTADLLSDDNMRAMLLVQEKTPL